MGLDFKKAGTKHCYACIQWEGKRNYYPEKKMFKVDDSKEGNCLIYHKNVKGTHFCENFDPVR